MPKPGLHSNFKYFFHLIWASYYWFSTKILNFKHFFYFLKSVKGGPLTKFFTNSAIFNRPLCQSQDFIRTLNIFSILFELPTIDSDTKILNFKHFFYFLKSVKGGPLTKFFTTSAILYSQATVPKPGLHSNFKYFFHLIWASYYWFSTKILNFKHFFYFLKSVKGGPLTKFFTNSAIFNRPLCQSQDFIRTLNIFSILFELPTIDSAQKF